MDFTKVALAVLFIALIDQLTLYLHAFASEPFYTNKNYFFIWSSVWLPWNWTVESLLLPLAFSLTKGAIFSFAYLSFVGNLRKGGFSPMRFLAILVLLSVVLPAFLVFIFFSIPFGFILLLSVQQIATCAASVFVLQKVVG